MKCQTTLLAFVTLWIAGCSTTSVSPAAWNAVVEGMTRQDIVARIGQPASQSPAGDTWSREGWDLRVAYDRGGQATNVVRMMILK